jgi:hypothetical protein
VESGFSSAAWGAFLSKELRLPVEVTYGRAQRQVLIARPLERAAAGTPGPSGYRVRMHAGFAAAPPEVRVATARWLASDRRGRRARRASLVLDAWIDDVLVPSIAAGPGATRVAPADARGAHHDLALHAAALLGRAIPAELLPPERVPAIAWGRRATTGARRSLHLGTYDGMHHLVRIHRVLDQPAVPEFFVRYVLFHELLHAAIPARREGRRTVHHGPDFRRRERAYPDFERAKRWENANIDALLRATRTGKPLRLRGWVQRLLFD